MKLTTKWHDRFVMARDTGKNEFPYSELVEMYGIALPNITQKFSEIMSEYPGAIEEVKQPPEIRYKVFRFNYDVLLDDEDYKEPEPEPDYPEWMERTTFDAIAERLALPDAPRVEYRYTEWDRRYQRGRVVVAVYSGVQKFPEYERVFLVDNCIVVN